MRKMAWFLVGILASGLGLAACSPSGSSGVRETLSLTSFTDTPALSTALRPTLPSSSVQTATPLPPSWPSPVSLNFVDQIGSGTASQIAWSPDGKTLAVAGSLGVTLYDAATSERTSLLPSENPLSSLAFTPDSGRLAVGTSAGHVEIWEYPSGRRLIDLPVGETGISGLGFSHDGKRLITGTRAGPVIALDMTTGRVLKQTQETIGYFSPLAVSPTGKLAAFADRDNTVRLIDTGTFRTLAALDAHNDYIVGLAFNRKGNLLASASLDGALLLWNIDSPSTPRLLKAIGATTGSYFYSTPSYFWDPGMYNSEDWSPALLFSPEDESIIAGALDGGMHYWPVEKYGYSGFFALGDKSAAFSPDGTRFASLDPTSVIHLYAYHLPENGSEEPLDNLYEISTHSGAIRSLTVSPDTLLTSDGRSFHSWSGCAGWCQDDILKFYTGFETFYPASDSDPAMKLLAAGGLGGNISLWEGPKSEYPGEFKQSLDAHPDPVGLNGMPSVESIRFSPDGRRFASIGINGDLAVWDAETLQRLFGDFLWKSHSPTFDSSGKLLAYAGGSLGAVADASVRVLDSSTGKLMVEIPTTTVSLAIAPNQKMIAIGDSSGKITLFSLPNGIQTNKWTAGGSELTSLLYYPDSRFLVAGSADGSLQLWDTFSGKLVDEQRAHQGPVTVLKLSADSRQLYSGGEDGTVKIWQLRPQP